jgi:thioesterase domain-containing protein
VTDTVSLQAEIEAQQATIEGLQNEVEQLLQLNSSKDELASTLQEGSERLRRQLEQEQELRQRAEAASKVRFTGGQASKLQTLTWGNWHAAAGGMHQEPGGSKLRACLGQTAHAGTCTAS